MTVEDLMEWAVENGAEYKTIVINDNEFGMTSSLALKANGDELIIEGLVWRE